MLTEIEIAEENGYRYHEHAGKIAEDRPLTLSQEFECQQVADDWEREYRAAKPEDRLT